MGAIRMLLHAQSRRRWRAWLGLAIVIGIAAGATTAAAAGARRAATAYPRLIRWSGAMDVSTGGFTGDESDWLTDLAAIEHLPQVIESAHFYAASFSIKTGTGRETEFGEVVPIFVAPRDARRAGRLKIVRGRAARSNRPDEGTISFAAVGPGLRTGDTVRVVFRNDNGVVLGEAPVRIVGVHADPGEFPSTNGAGFAALALSPAFLTPHRQFIPDDSSHLGLAVRLRHGAADFEAFRAEALKRRIPVEFPAPTVEHTKGVQKTIRFESVSLWLLAALLAVAAIAILGQALSRQSRLDADDHPKLSALGMSRRDLFVAGLLRSLAIGAIASGVAVFTAILASPLTPIGLARTAEPTPGILIDGTVLIIGALATALVVAAVSAPAAWRDARMQWASAVRDADAAAPSRIAAAFARAGVGPSATTGIGMAVEGGRQGKGVPVRSAILGTALAVAAIVMSLVFVTSLNHLINTPRLIGITWDAQVTGRKDLPDAVDLFDRATRAAKDLSAAGSISIHRASETLGKALTEPIQGLAALRDAGIRFTDNERRTLGALADTASRFEKQDEFDKASRPRLESQNIIVDRVIAILGGKASGTAQSPVLEAGPGGASNIEIAGERMLAFTYEARGLVRPAIVEGRVPSGPRDIALGAITMRRSGMSIGSRVRVVQACDEGEDCSAERPSALYTIVGRVIMPGFFFEGHEPGVGAAMTNEAAARIFPPTDDQELSYFLRLAPGVEFQNLQRDPLFRATVGNQITFVPSTIRPTDLDTVERMGKIPLVLAALLAAMGGASLVHSLVTSVRRRRRDLAILKTLGFTRRQSSATVAWQTSAMAIVAVAVGVPGGIAAGRWAWSVFAEQLSVFPEPLVPALAVAVVVPATLVLANVIAAFPARAAGRTRPALVLRSE